MILKSYIVEQNLNVINEYQAVLLYGVNNGIKDDIKSKLLIINKETEIINFFENEIIKDKNMIFHNVVNESLFSVKKIIFVHSATDKVFNEIYECLMKKNKSIKIYIFSDNLEKKSKLRNFFEKEKNLAILPCYEDNEKTLSNYICKELMGFKGLTGELIDLIITNSNSNRKIIQSEIVKIKDFFSEKKINKLHLLDILNIKNNTSFDEIRDNALLGDKNKTNKLLSEIEILSDDCFFYLYDINYRVLKLINIQISDKIYKNYEKTIDKLKPPIFWKDKSVFLQQLKKWDLEKLNKLANKIAETEILMKKNSQINNSIIIKNFIVALSTEVSTASSF
jgi:DNA polymerase-3 subunit delta